MLIAFLLAAQAAASGPALPEGPALTEQIRARDADLFTTLFERCDPEHMRSLVTADIEFYHDRDGAMHSADAFVADYARFCTERRAPDAWRSRRELVAASLNVHPVPGYGAIEDGEHLFYERQGEGPERLVGRARFTQLWKLEADGWRLARVFSYAHGPAGE